MSAPFSNPEDNDIVWDERYNEMTSRGQLRIRRNLEVATTDLAASAARAVGTLALCALYVPFFIYEQATKKKP